MSDHARSSRTQASTLVSLPSTPPPARTFFDGAPGPFPRRHEGTQGPGHFTVQPCGPHYRAHPLRFCGFAESLKGRTGDTGDTGDTGARVNARRTSRCPSGVSRRPICPICPIRPICPTASSFGTSQACRGCRGNWKLGSLEAWRLGFLGGAPPHTLQLLRRALVARSVLRGRGRFGPPGLHALFSVLRGASAPL